MRKIVAATAAVAIAVLGIAPSASAFVGGGTKPSQAPTIAWGQHYSGELNNHRNEANFEPNSYAGQEAAFYRLPPVGTRDQIVVNWQSVPFAHSSGFPVCLQFVQGANDFNWASSAMFNYGECDPPNGFELSGSGTAASQITVQAADAANTYLEFISRAGQNEPSLYETFPYGFGVEAPRHYLNLAISPFTEVAANGVVHASVTGASGLPAPDGLIYGLTVHWRDGGIATYTAASVGGQVAFQLALPESAIKKSAGFIVGRGPDAQYQAVEAPVVRAKVTSPVVPAPSSACKKATVRVHVLARQHHRLQGRSRRARGHARQRLHHRARRVGRELHAARAQAARACVGA